MATWSPRMPTCSRAASTSGRGSPRNGPGSSRPRSTPSRPRTRSLTTETVEAILARAGLGPASDGAAATFERFDGSPGRVDRAAEIDQHAPIPGNAPLVVQVSRWDALKDPTGVLQGFAEHTEHDAAHLLLAGPSVAAVSDDPEGAEVLADVRRMRAGLPSAIRERVHLACLPMEDVEENAAIVNAIQRRAQVVVQKSLAEGFGLTVAEAMWKARPMVASRAGGIQDQIVDGETGVLLDDPRDLARLRARLRRAAGRPGARREDRHRGPGMGDRGLSRPAAPGPVPATARRADHRPGCR